MQRRQFIKNSCNACLLLAAGYILPELTGCTPSKYAIINTASPVNDIIEVPLAAFTQSALQIVRPKGWYYDIAVQKKNDNTFSSLLLQCTHQDNQLDITGNGYHCSLHGSVFDKEGKVKKGPAEMPLHQYTTTINQDKLIIHLK